MYHLNLPRSNNKCLALDDDKAPENHRRVRHFETRNVSIFFPYFFDIFYFLSLKIKPRGSTKIVWIGKNAIFLLPGFESLSRRDTRILAISLILERNRFDNSIRNQGNIQLAACFHVKPGVITYNLRTSYYLSKKR